MNKIKKFYYLIHDWIINTWYALHAPAYIANRPKRTKKLVGEINELSMDLYINESGPEEKEDTAISCLGKAINEITKAIENRDKFDKILDDAEGWIESARGWNKDKEEK